MRHAAAVLPAVLVMACQTYDFEPGSPFAIAQTTIIREVGVVKPRPNVMLVVDKSGSMHQPIDPTDQDCGNCGSAEAVCPASCPTRLSELRAATGDFLSSYGSDARYGLAAFPDTDTSALPCEQGRVFRPVVDSSDDASALNAAAAAIREDVLALGTPGGLPAIGGTPTAATLAAIAEDAALSNETRDDLVILLTDGLPNCNAALDPKTCTCVNGKVPCDDARNCLDETRVIQSVNALKKKSIRTVVVGFGADTGATLARPVLNAMAEAGGFARDCSSDADCGSGDRCDVAQGRCSTRFYQAESAAELGAALKRIRDLQIFIDPCEYQLTDGPSQEDEELVAVYVAGEIIPRGDDTWTYTAPPNPKVTIVAALCERLKNAPTTQPITVEVRAVQPF